MELKALQDFEAYSEVPEETVSKYKGSSSGYGRNTASARSWAGISS